MALTLTVFTFLVFRLAHATDKEPHEQRKNPGESWLDTDFYPTFHNKEAITPAQSDNSKSEPTKSQAPSTKDTKQHEISKQCVGAEGIYTSGCPLLMSHYRRYVSVLVNMLDEKRIAAGTDFIIYCNLEETKFQLLKNFSRDQHVAIQEVNLVLEKMITDVSTTSGEHVPPTLLFGFDRMTLLGMLTTVVICIVSVLLSFWLIIQISRVPLLPVWKYFVGFVFLVLIASTVIEWFHLYQTAVAEKMSTQAKDIPPECTAEGATGWTTLASWMKSTFTLSEDACLKYYQAVAIDPIVRSNPTKALVISFTHVIVEPMKMIFSGLGVAFRGLLQPLPVQWQPFVFIVAILLLVLFLIMVMRYSLRLSVLFSLVPALTDGKEMKDMLLQLKELNRALQGQIQSLQAMRPLLAIKDTEHPANKSAELLTTVQESHLNIPLENDFDTKANVVDSIGASVSGQ
ncbi:uncharacterized protein LOC134185529 [Corticium candelabrum]|uniref:uncharacterized protein LOC134185529 n=1 Tax=Corticium candelabrum TaxID=121492 RepID=UPI002E2631AC|nr:uncharacterized protein LOC134185529 [Corticium candelabrum]